MKNFWNLVEKIEKKIWYWWKIRTRSSGSKPWVRLPKEHAPKGLMQHHNFCIFYWLICLIDHAFILVLWQLLVWLLVERSQGVKRSLLSFPAIHYEWCWWTSRGIWLPMRASRCFFLLGSFSTKQNNRSLAFGCYDLLVGHTPRCQWLLWPHLFYSFQSHILTLFLALVGFYPLTLFLWSSTPVVTHRIYYIFFPL